MDEWIDGLLGYAKLLLRRLRTHESINPIIHQSSHPSIPQSFDPLHRGENLVSAPPFGAAFSEQGRLVAGKIADLEDPAGQLADVVHGDFPLVAQRDEPDLSECIGAFQLTG